MKLARNVQDATPLRLDRREITHLAGQLGVRHGIGAGQGVLEAFARLGGRYREVLSTFGLDDDRIVCRGPTEVEAVGEREAGCNLVLLGEALAILLLHRPLAVSRHGSDVVLAVPRLTPDGDGFLVMREALWFGTALVMPTEDFRTAHAGDPDPESIARRFGVSRRTAQGRARSLGLAIPEPA